MKTIVICLIAALLTVTLAGNVSAHNFYGRTFSHGHGVSFGGYGYGGYVSYPVSVAFPATYVAAPPVALLPSYRVEYNPVTVFQPTVKVETPVVPVVEAQPVVLASPTPVLTAAPVVLSAPVFTYGNFAFRSYNYGFNQFRFGFNNHHNVRFNIHNGNFNFRANGFRR